MDKELKMANLTQKSNIQSVLTREGKFSLRYDMYHDNYKQQVYDRLLEVYTNATSLKMDKQLDLTNNVFKTIIKKISYVYKDGVNRSTEDEKMLSIYKEADVNKIMVQANRYTNAFNDILLQISWDNEVPKFVFRYPHKTRVKVNDFNEPIEVEYFVSMSGDSQKWAFWSKEEHYYKIYGSDEKFEKESVNEGDVNPYKVLPFVFMQNGFRDNGFFDMFSGDDLTEITLDIGVYGTFKKYMIKWNSFKQIIATGERVGSISGQFLDPSTPITAEGDGLSINILDLQSDIKSLSEVIEQDAVNVAINYNISPSNFKMSGQVSSGFALMMENLNLDLFVKEQQRDFIKYEKDLHKLITIIGNINGAGLSENEDFFAVFEDFSYKESKESVLNSQEKSISLGLTSAVKIIMQNENVTEEEAIGIYEENINQRNKANNQLNAPIISEADTAEALGL